MRKSNIIIKKVRNLMILSMAVIVIISVYFNILNSRAKETTDIVANVTDETGEVDSQKVTLVATGNKNGNYEISLPETISNVYVSNYKTLNGDKSANDKIVLSQDEVENKEINLEVNYDKKNVTSTKTNEEMTLYKQNLEYDDKGIYVEGYMPLLAQINVIQNENDISLEILYTVVESNNMSTKEIYVPSEYEQTLKITLNKKKYGVEQSLISSTDAEYIVVEQSDSKLVINNISSNTIDITNEEVPTIISSQYNGEDNKYYFAGGPIANSQIESIKFVTNPKEVLGTKWDASENGDNSVIAGYIDSNGNELYEIYVASNSDKTTKVYTPEDASYMFYECSNLTTIDIQNLGTSKTTNMNSMFAMCTNITTLELQNLDTSNVEDMENMFFGCENLETLDISNFITAKVTTMSNMFQNCKKLTELNLKSFDTSKVIDMNSMFNGCESLTILNLNNFNTTEVTDMSWMFYNCKNITTLDISNFDTSQVTKMGGMFYECNSLTSLDLSNFNTSQVTNMDSMFWKCSNLTTIYVSKYDETTDKGWTVKNVEYSFGMFYEAVKLVGGNGTKYNSSNKDDETYARIDEAGQLGYLTDITKKGIRLDKYNIILDMSGNKTAKLTATISQDISNKNSKITWTTSDSTKVQVDQEGNITAKAITTSNNAVTITATTSSGYNASCLVVVKSSITSISVSPTSGNMEVNQTLQLTLVIDPETTTEKITWKSRNKDVAKVDNNGKVTAIGNGKVEIIAQNPSGTIKAICTLTVTEAIAPEPPTITPDYNEELGTIEINVNLSSIDENMESTNSSELINSIIESEKFNVGIFLDEDGTILAFEDYNKEIKFENSNSTTVSYNNIPEGTYYIFALDEDGNPINVSSFWTGNTNYMLSYNFGTDMNETNSVTVKSKSKQQVVLNYVVTIVPDGS